MKRDNKHAGVQINPCLHRFLEVSFHNSHRNQTGEKKQKFRLKISVFSWLKESELLFKGIFLTEILRL